jgi:hypothetical protein
MKQRCVTKTQQIAKSCERYWPCQTAQDQPDKADHPRRTRALPDSLRVESCCAVAFASTLKHGKCDETAVSGSGAVFRRAGPTDTSNQGKTVSTQSVIGTTALFVLHSICMPMQSDHSCAGPEMPAAVVRSVSGHRDHYTTARDYLKSLTFRAFAALEVQLPQIKSRSCRILAPTDCPALASARNCHCDAGNDRYPRGNHVAHHPSAGPTHAYQPARHAARLHS